MSDASIVAILAAIPVIFTGITATILQLRKVHTLVNSQMTAVKADLTIANKRIESLLLLIAEKEKKDVKAEATIDAREEIKKDPLHPLE
jgi:hypothetical protein